MHPLFHLVFQTIYSLLRDIELHKINILGLGCGKLLEGEISELAVSYREDSGDRRK
jgi:hypothetical protein